MTVKIALLLSLGIIIPSCKKFVEVDIPITNTNAELVFRNDASAIAAVNNIYAEMSSNGIYNGITSMSMYPGLSADELLLFPHVNEVGTLAFQTNSLIANDVSTGNYWISIYSSYIYYLNSAIEGLTTTSSLTEQIRKQLLGEAKFLRGFCYFYLVNLYGDVPLVLTTDYRKNSQIARSLTKDVYEQIKLDLLEAKQLLNDNYLDGSLLKSTIDRVTPNKSTASSLLARMYLYLQEWDNAESEASEVINNTSLYDTTSLNNVFLKNSKEAIWQLQSVSASLSNTSDASLFMQAKVFFLGGRVHLSNSLMASFEPNDERRKQWVDSVTDNNVTYYLPYKYKIYESSQPETERTVIFRIAEQYLIRAEARAQIGNYSGALTDLNLIRKRAGLNNIEFSTKAELLNKILHERQVELFTEWGHRWLDLKRLNKANDVLKAIKGDDWQSTDELYPIPFSEIQINRSLEGHQNPGY